MTGMVGTAMCSLPSRPSHCAIGVETIMLRRGLVLLTAIAAVSLVLTATPGFAERTPPGSFLRDRVTSPQALSSQIGSVNYVAQRYATHYGLKADEVARRFATLEYRMLSKDIRTQVWFIGKGNRIISEMRTFKAGTPMFFTASGQPVLDARCGNPLSRSVPRVVAQQPAPQTMSSPESTVAAQVTEVPAEVTLAQAVPVQPEPVITQVLAQPTEVIAAETVVPTVSQAVTTTVVENVPVATAGGGIGAAGGLLALPLIALAAGGGGGGGTPIVPEPGTLVTLAGGLAAMGGTWLRSRKS